MIAYIAEHPYVWAVASIAMLAVGGIAASGWGSWGRR